MIERADNTEYILSLSYGKDSIASLEACKQLGWPVDRIVHAEVWATDDIPADLPPMVEFKEYADKIIKERYGIDVEHVCATCTIDKKHNPMYPPVAVGGGINTPTKTSSTKQDITRSTEKSTTDSPGSDSLGAQIDSKQKCLKLTYQDIFYKPISNSKSTITKGNRIYGFPIARGPWCNSDLKLAAIRGFQISPTNEGLI